MDRAQGPRLGFRLADVDRGLDASAVGGRQTVAMAHAAERQRPQAALGASSGV